MMIIGLVFFLLQVIHEDLVRTTFYRIMFQTKVVHFNVQFNLISFSFVEVV